MRVLLISHTCQSAVEGQPKAQVMGTLPGMDLRVLVPHQWLEYGKWRAPSPPNPNEASFTYTVGRVACAWAGPAQCYLHSYPGLARLLRTFRPDIIDIWEEPWSLLSAQVCWLRNRLLPSAKIVSETEANINRSHPYPFENWRTYTFQNADFVVGRSEEAVEVVRAKGYDGPAAAVGNAVDSMLFRPMDREACREALGVSGFVVGYMGRLVPEKGLMDLVEALAHPHCPSSVNLLLVGQGDFQAVLAERAAALGVDARVRFVPARSLNDLPGIMNALDVFTLPSRTTRTWKEQFGRVIIEAHACGIPVIGSDSGAIPQVVGAGGLIVPEGDSSALATAFATLASNSVETARKGRLGLAQVHDRYTWEQVARQMFEIYQSILKPRSITEQTLMGRYSCRVSDAVADVSRAFDARR